MSISKHILESIAIYGEKEHYEDNFVEKSKSLKKLSWPWREVKNRKGLYGHLKNGA